MKKVALASASKLLMNRAINDNSHFLSTSTLVYIYPTDYQLEIIYIVNDYRTKHQPLTKLTTQYSLLGDS